MKTGKEQQQLQPHQFHESTWILSPALLGFYLECVASRIDSGFDDAEIDQAISKTEWLGIKERCEWWFTIEYRHQTALMRLQIEMADIETLLVTIKTHPALIDEINRSAQSCYNQLITGSFLPGHSVFRQPPQ